jgi:hypothetical protein
VRILCLRALVVREAAQTRVSSLRHRTRARGSRGLLARVSPHSRDPRRALRVLLAGPGAHECPEKIDCRIPGRLGAGT